MAADPIRAYAIQVRRADSQLRCSFCAEAAGPGDAVRGDGVASVAICVRCLEACRPLLARRPEDRLPAPAWIKRRLDRTVVGQERAKRQLAVAVHTHLRRAQVGAQAVGLSKANVLLLGPTGTGKTHFVRALARLLDLPLHVGDATALTEAGYVGEDASGLLKGLLQAAKGDLGAAQRGILYIDEVDKLARRSGSATSERDVGGEGVQQSLLKLIEGCTVDLQVPTGRGRTRRVSFDTAGVLVICGGAFEGLDRIIGRRTSRATVGFGAPHRAATSTVMDVRPEDLHRFGLIPELVGRLPVLASLSALDEDQLVRILTEPRDALVAQYQRLLRMDGVDLRFTTGGLRAVASRCLALGAGARGLRGILEEVLLEVMYEAPDRDDLAEVWITAAVVEGHASPLLGLRSETG